MNDLDDATLGGAGRRSQKSRTAQTKSQILDAARELFARRGFDGVRLDDIAKLSGVKRSLILYHFTNKDELWKAAASLVIDEFNTEMCNRLAELGDVVDSERGARLTDIWLSGWLDMPEAAQFLVREGGEPSDRLDWLVETVGVSAMRLDELERSRRDDPIPHVAFVTLCLGLAALGPLLESKLGAATDRRYAGLWPISKRNKEKFSRILQRLTSS